MPCCADDVSADAPAFLFLDYWTKKGAVIKADGRALDFPLKNVRFEDGTGIMGDSKWFIHELAIDPLCHTWLACNKENVEIQLIEYFPPITSPS